MKKIILPLIVLLGFILLCSLPTEAASMNAFIDVDAYVEVGSQFKVTVRYESDIETFVQATVSYDSSVVTFVSSSSPSDVNNSKAGEIKIAPLSSKTSHRIDLYFKMEQETSASFSTQVVDSLTIDLKPAGTPSANATTTGFYPTPVPVTPTPTPPPTPTPTPFIPTLDPSATPSTPLEFLENGEMRFIAENFSEETVQIPEGFEKTQYSYKGNNIFVAKNQHGVIMFYATNLIGENGKFYIYNSKNDIRTPYMEFIQGANTYTFLIPSDTMPEGFTEITVKIGDYDGITAYTIPSENYVDFDLVYAFNKTNAPAFYLYDTQEGTLQRCIDITLLGNIGASATISPSPTVQHSPAASLTPTKTEPDHGSNRIDSQTLILIIIGICLAAAIAAVIIIIVRNHKINRSYDAEENDVELLEDIMPERSQSQEEAESAPEPETNNETEDRSEEKAKEEDDDDILHLSNRFPH